MNSQGADRTVLFAPFFYAFIQVGERMMKEKQTITGISKNGFTLIELLVVISIISLLASILVPTLGRAKAHARKLVCLSNQRVMGSGFLYYAHDNRSGLPRVRDSIDKVLPYLDQTTMPENSMDCTRQTMPKALFCPSDPDPFPRPFMDFLAKMEMTSWCLNGADTTSGMGGGAKIHMGLFGGKGKIIDPVSASACMMLAGSTSFDRIGDLDHPAAADVFAKAGASGQMNSARVRWHHRMTTGFFHNGQVNVFFVDGHGESHQGKNVGTLPVSQWPYAYSLNKGTTFYPNFSLPTAAENPQFWGPPYDRW